MMVMVVVVVLVLLVAPVLVALLVMVTWIPLSVSSMMVGLALVPLLAPAQARVCCCCSEPCVRAIETLPALPLQPPATTPTWA